MTFLNKMRNILHKPPFQWTVTYMVHLVWLFLCGYMLVAVFYHNFVMYNAMRDHATVQIMI